MSTTIDQRVVEMRFDNRQFESNVATTMSTLDRLKHSLSLDDTARTMGLKFDAMYSMTDQFVRRITDRVMNFGERIVKSLTIDPITTGFSEYETQIGAIQTILSNTKSKGSTLDDVNSALDELNTYADKTIYNFTEMTRNIGTFTAAGVELDTSVSAIKGIANLAAISGSTSQQASTAMYQLSQAMASGTVKLMDWNSVVNAGMGGQVFQDALKETAKVHGVAIDDIIKKQGSFRESLSEGWLTTDILTETLSKFTGDLTEEQLKTMGYTEEQIKGIMELGKDANDAATKVKTLSQLFDTLKEAAQSGWAQTWEIIVGDFEEAKALFTQVSDVISGMIGDSAAARNDMLENWKVLGGRTDLIDALSNTFHGVMAIVGAVREAFTDIFPPLTAEKLAGFTEGLKNLTAKLKNISGGTLDKIKRTFKGLFALLDIGVMLFKAIARGVGELLGHLAPAGNGLLGFTAGLGDALVALRDLIESSGIFNIVVGKIVDILGVCIKVIGKFVSFIVSGFKKLGSLAMPGIESFINRIETRFGQLRSIGESLKKSFTSIGNFFKGLFTAITPLIKGIGKMISNLFTSIANAFKEADFNTLNDILNVGLTGGLGVLVAKLIGFMSQLEEGFDIQKIFKKLKLDKIVKGVNEVIDGVTGCFKAFQSSLKADVLMKIAKAIAILTAALVILSLIDSDRLTVGLSAITTLFLELFTTMKIFDGLDMVKATGKDGFGGISSTATSLIGVAITLLLLSFVVAKLGKMDPESLIKGLFATMMMLMTVAYSMQYFAVGIDKETKKAEKSIIKGTKRLIAITTALAALAGIVVLLGNMETKDMIRGIVGMVAVVGAMVGLMFVMNKVGGMSAAGGFGMLLAAGALIILAGAFKIIGLLKWSEIGKGLVTIGAAMLILAVGLTSMVASLPGAAALVVASKALIWLAAAMAAFSLISWGGVLKALFAIGGALIVMAVGLTAMMAALPGAAALVVASVGLTMLAGAMAVLGTLKWGTIIKSIVTMAAVFAVLGAAALILSPVILVVLALSAALSLIGVGLLASAIGMTMLSAGLTAFAAAFMVSAPMIMTGIKSIITGFISLIPAVIQAFGNGLIKICEVIIKAAPKIGETLIVLVNTLCDVLMTCIPKIVTVVFELLIKVLDALGTYTPKIVDAIFKFVIGLLDGLSRHMPALIQSLVNVFMSIFQGAVDALKSIDTDVLLKGLLAIGLFTGIAIALGAVAGFIPAAMLGVLGLGALIAEFALVLAAIGKLAQIEGLSWLIGEGGKLMAKIGDAIGGFIGSIVGSALEGISASFPQIGKDLAGFMREIQPFIEGAKSIDSSTFDGVSRLVGIILALTAANVLDSLTKWFTGGSSLADFGAQLIPFGLYMVAFSKIVSGNVDEGAVMAAANAGKLLAEMADTIPNTGGLVSFFTGENDITAFGAKLIPFGACMVAFSAIVSGKIDEGAVTAAANAGKALAEMAATIPNTGGVVSFFTGDNDIATFGAKLIPFGVAMAAFSLAVRGKINKGDVEAAANAGKAMVEMANTIPKTGGVVSFFTGDNDMATFGSQLVAFGAAMALFSAEVKNIDKGAVETSATAGQALAAMAATIPTTGGVFSWFSGDSDMSTFGKNLVAFGAGMAAYSAEVSLVNTAKLSATTAEFTKIADMAKGMSGTDFGGLANFGESLSKVGKKGIDNFIKAFSNAHSKVSKAGKEFVDKVITGAQSKGNAVDSAFKKIAKAAANAVGDTKSYFYEAGKELAAGLKEGISSGKSGVVSGAIAMAKEAVRAVKEALDINSPSKVFEDLGVFVPEGFAMGITKLGGTIESSTTDMADSAISGVKSSISKLSDIVNSDIDTQPTIRPVLDLSDVESGARSIGGLFGDKALVTAAANVGAISSMNRGRNQNGGFDELLSAFNGLRKDINGMEHNTYNLNGISYEEGSDVAEAFKTIVRAAKIERRR